MMSSPKRQRSEMSFSTPPYKTGVVTSYAPNGWSETKTPYKASKVAKTPKAPAAKHTLSFDSFPDALPKVPPSSMYISPDKSHRSLSFPDLSPMPPPLTPTFCRVAADELESPFQIHCCDGSTISANSSFSRPLPDQSAFDTSISSSKKGTPHRSPLCPPTPVRQPAWADTGVKMPRKLDRRSSLCTTKVLLTLPEFPEKPDTPLQSFSQFENLGWIGSGTFAEVYKMKSRADGLVYAIKKSKRQFRSKRDRARLLQEITTYEKLQLAQRCENIVHYYRAWQEDGYFYIQTELCERGTLQDFTEILGVGVHVPELTVWSILQDVAHGLAFIHAAGVVHLDIKPQNVFIAENGTLKIGDFGTAVTIGTKDDDSEGDSYYMAKELLTYNPIQPSADIFSFGLMLYELCTAIELPQDGVTWHELRDGNSPSIPSDYSQDLHQLIRQMMHPDPTARPSAEKITQHPRLIELDPSRDSFILQHVQSDVLKQKLFGSIPTPFYNIVS